MVQRENSSKLLIVVTSQAAVVGLISVNLFQSPSQVIYTRVYVIVINKPYKFPYAKISRTISITLNLNILGVMGVPVLCGDHADQ